MKKLFLILILSTTIGCEVLEEDISNREIQLLAPANHAMVEAGIVTFGWEAVDYAIGYRFTLVTPSFAAADCIIADTVIYADTLYSTLKCRVLLPAGKYEWSVVGFNGGYKTSAEMHNLTVFSSEDLYINASISYEP